MTPPTENAIDVESARDENAGSHGRDVANVEDVDYSVFTNGQRHYIVFMASWAGFFSPVSSQIYFPALNTLANDLDVSNALINLTLTSYMVCQYALGLSKLVTLTMFLTDFPRIIADVYW